MSNKCVPLHFEKITPQSEVCVTRSFKVKYFRCASLCNTITIAMQLNTYQ